MKNEPVITATGIPGIITAGVAFAQAMGWLHLSGDQLSALLAFLGTITAFGAVWARGKVSPTG